MGVPFWAQTNALVRKNFLYQRRRYGTNVCLVLTPLLVLGLAYVLQVLGHRAASKEGQGILAETLMRNLNVIPELEGRNVLNVIYQSVVHNSQQARHHNRRIPPPWKQGFGLLYTADNETLAQEMLGSQLDVLGDAQVDNQEAALYFVGQSQTYQEQGEITLRGEMFGALGLSIATDHFYDLPVYIDKGLFSLGVKSSFVSNQCLQIQIMSELIQSSVNLTNLLSEFGGGLGFGSDRAVRETGVVCSNIVPSFRASTKDLRRRLFCNWAEAGCKEAERTLDGELMGTYGSAWNLKDTSHKHFNVDIWLPVRSSFERAETRAHMPQNFAANSFLKWVTGDNERSAALLGLQELPKPETKLAIDFSSLMGPVLFSWVVTLFVPISLAQITYEKEHGLEMMMIMMGLGNSTNLIVLYLFYYTMYVLYILVFLIAGIAIGWNFFTGNSYGVQALYYLIVGHTQVASSFAMGTFFKEARSATGFAYIWIIGNGLVANFLYVSQATKPNQLVAGIMELFPPIAVYRGMWEFSVYATFGEQSRSHGMTWESLLDDGNGFLRILVISIVEWPVFMLIAWMRSGGNGKHLELPSLKAIMAWTKSVVVKKKLHSQNSIMEMAPTLSRRHVRSDGAQNFDFEANCGPDPWENAPPGEFAVAARNLRKVFPAPAGGSPKVAVADLNLSVKSGEVFGLLGPNGAGKSTAISLMIGLQSPTDGTVYVDGLSILDDKYKIYNRMGVCAQDNHIWGSLTGREHLTFYGQLKGIPRRELQDAVDSALAAVGLLAWGVGDKKVGKYSGGMKRRLCVAIALIGKPKAVYLDEPSTGMDLYSRRMLWAAVRDARKDCGIVLTTHSMEEAEALCDRIGIFVAGKLVCVGSPKELKSKFGGYMVLTLMMQPEKVVDARKMIEQIWPSARLLHSQGGLLKFKLDAKIKASDVFSVMQDIMPEEVHNWSVTHASLEEIFIMVVRDIVGFDALQ